MTRIVLGIATAVWLLTSCTGSGAEPDADARGGAARGGEAEAAKTEMDALAEKLLPELVPVLGGQVSDMEARFVERGGFGQYDYLARAQVVRPSPREQALAHVKRVLEEQGLTVESPGRTADVTGTTGNVRVSVSWTAGDAVDTAELVMSTLQPASGDDDYAADAPATDYAAYWR